MTSFGATGVQDIASAAEVPKGSFYIYFDSKDAYAAEILDVYWHEIDASAGGLLRDPLRPPFQAVCDFFDALIEYHAEQRFVPGCLMGNLALELSATNRLVRDKVQHLFAQWTSELAVRLTEASSRSASSRNVDPHTIAACLVDSFEGAVLRAKVEQSRSALERFRLYLLPQLLGENGSRKGRTNRKKGLRS